MGVCEMFCAIKMKTIKKCIAAGIVLAVLAAGVYQLSRWFPVRYIDEITTYAEQYDLPPAFVCAVIHAESRFRPEVQSPRGASGLMQLMPITADWGAAEIGLPDYSYDRIHEPELNIQIGCWYLRRLLDQYGVADTALAAYNAGSGNVSGWLSDAAYSADGRSLTVIPFGETARYVEKINRNQRIYEIILMLRRYV